MSNSNNNIFSYQTYTKPEIDNNEDPDYYDEDNNSYEDDDFIEQINMPGNKSIGGGNKKKSNKSKTTPSIIATNNITTKIDSETDNSIILDEHKQQDIKPKKLTKSEIQSIIDDEVENKKKERLPSSEEVINRIKFDYTFKDKQDNFIISYEDRFDGMKYAIFKEFEFGVIPLHRIQKIKYLNTVVWDRQERIYDFSIFDNNQLDDQFSNQF